MVLHEFPYNRLAPTLSVVEWLLNLMGTLALKLGGVKAHRGSLSVVFIWAVRRNTQMAHGFFLHSKGDYDKLAP